MAKKVRQIAKLNETTKEKVSFIGGGAYEHHIPAIIRHIVSRQEFLTAYTPYQPEMSQGTLQAIFEYQTMICELTGMDVSNASLYDGGTAMAEAVFMASHGNKKSDVLISKTVHPNYREVVRTYAYYNGLNYLEIEEKDGKTDLVDLRGKMGPETCCVVLQTPNYYGIVENGYRVREIMDATKNKARFIVSAEPVSLSFFEAPGYYGADIVVGEGQPLGNTLQFGGPYLGFIAATKAEMRRMPGRIVGQTTDIEGRRAFVLTLQAREQHIRREKATSNITSNQGLNALMASIYLSSLGKKGLLDVAKQSMYKAHYLANALTAVEGIDLEYGSPFFNEFVIRIPGKADEIYERMIDHGFYSGVVLDEHRLLLCVTEIHDKQVLDRFAAEMEGIL